MPREWDSDEVKAVNEYIAKAPEYFEKTDLMYDVFIKGDPINNKPSVITIIQNTQDKVNSLFKLGWMVTGAVISVMVAAVVSGVILLVRLSPIIAELEVLARTKP